MLDCAGEWRLLDVQTLCRTSKMRLFRDSYEVPKMANFHFVTFVNQTSGDHRSDGT
jgi:hypothetical protein